MSTVREEVVKSFLSSQNIQKIVEVSVSIAKYLAVFAAYALVIWVFIQCMTYIFFVFGYIALMAWSWGFMWSFTITSITSTIVGALFKLAPNFRRLFIQTIKTVFSLIFYVVKTLYPSLVRPAFKRIAKLLSRTLSEMFYSMKEFFSLSMEQFNQTSWEQYNRTNNLYVLWNILVKSFSGFLKKLAQMGNEHYANLGVPSEKAVFTSSSSFLENIVDIFENKTGEIWTKSSDIVGYLRDDDSIPKGEKIQGILDLKITSERIRDLSPPSFVLPTTTASSPASSSSSSKPGIIEAKIGFLYNPKKTDEETEIAGAQNKQKNVFASTPGNILGGSKETNSGYNQRWRQNEEKLVDDPKSSSSENLNNLRQTFNKTINNIDNFIRTHALSVDNNSTSEANKVFVGDNTVESDVKEALERISLKIGFFESVLSLLRITTPEQKGENIIMEEGKRVISDILSSRKTEPTVMESQPSSKQQDDGDDLMNELSSTFSRNYYSSKQEEPLPPPNPSTDCPTTTTKTPDIGMNSENEGDDNEVLELLSTVYNIGGDCLPEKPKFDPPIPTNVLEIITPMAKSFELTQSTDVSAIESTEMESEAPQSKMTFDIPPNFSINEEDFEIFLCELFTNRSSYKNGFQHSLFLSDQIKYGGLSPVHNATNFFFHSRTPDTKVDPTQEKIRTECVSKFMSILYFNQRGMNQMFADQIMFKNYDNISHFNNKIIRAPYGKLLSLKQSKREDEDEEKSPTFSKFSLLQSGSTGGDESPYMNIKHMKYAMENITRSSSMIKEIDVLPKTSTVDFRLSDKTSPPDVDPSIHMNFGMGFLPLSFGDIVDTQKSEPPPPLSSSTDPNVIQFSKLAEQRKTREERQRKNVDTPTEKINDRNYQRSKSDENVKQFVFLIKDIIDSTFFRPPELTSDDDKKYATTWWNTVSLESTVKPVMSNRILAKVYSSNKQGYDSHLPKVTPEDLCNGFGHYFVTDGNGSPSPTISLDDVFTNEQIESISSYNNFQSVPLEVSSGPKIDQVDPVIREISNDTTKNFMPISRKSSDFIYLKYYFVEPRIILETPKKFTYKNRSTPVNNKNRKMFFMSTIFSRALSMKMPVDLVGFLKSGDNEGELLSFKETDFLKPWNPITASRTTHFSKHYTTVLDVGFLMAEDIYMNQPLLVGEEARSEFTFVGTNAASWLKNMTLQKQYYKRKTRVVSIPKSKLIISSLNSREPEDEQKMFSVHLLLDIPSFYQTLVKSELVVPSRIYRQPTKRWCLYYSNISGLKVGDKEHSELSLQPRTIFTTFMETIDIVNVLCLALYKGYAIACHHMELLSNVSVNCIDRNVEKSKMLWQKVNEKNAMLIKTANHFSSLLKSLLLYIPDPFLVFKEISQQIIVDNFDPNVQLSKENGKVKNLLLWMQRVEPLAKNFVMDSKDSVSLMRLSNFLAE